MSTPESEQVSPSDIRRLARRVAEEAVAQYLRENPPGQAAAVGGDDEVDAPPEPVYASKEVFFTEYIAPIFARDPRSPSVNFCLQPFEHPEFAEVMGVLHHVWELNHAGDPLMGLPIWFRDWAYPMLAHLFSPAGTFAYCQRKEGGHSPVGVGVRPLTDDCATN